MRCVDTIPRAIVFFTLLAPLPSVARASVVQAADRSTKSESRTKGRSHKRTKLFRTLLGLRRDSCLHRFFYQMQDRPMGKRGSEGSASPARGSRSPTPGG